MQRTVAILLISAGALVCVAGLVITIYKKTENDGVLIGLFALLISLLALLYLLFL